MNFPLPESRLLASLVSGQLDPRTVPIDQWEAIVPMALAHNLGSMLNYYLRQAGLDTQEAVWSKLHEAAQVGVLRWLVLLSTQKTVQNRLQSAGVPCVWLKGFALAHTVYPEPALRYMSDLDVLVLPENRDTALSILKQLGYTCPYPEVYSVQLFHHTHMVSSGPRPVVVELHHHLLGWVDNHLSVDGLGWFWAHTGTFDHGGVTFTHFRPEAELVYLCAHALLQHGEAEISLRDYLDLHLLITRSNELAWPVVVDQAVSLGWTFAIELALSQTQTFFNTGIPPQVFTSLRQLRPAWEDPTRVSLKRQYATRPLAKLSELKAMPKGAVKAILLSYIFPPPKHLLWRYGAAGRWKLPIYYSRHWLEITRPVVAVAFRLLKR
jgi:hypothetical protein